MDTYFNKSLAQRWDQNQHHPMQTYIWPKKIDPEVIKLGLKYGKYGESSFQMLKRFLDDFFMVFKGTTKQLHEIFKELNNTYPTLKFTMEHTTPT